MWCMFMVSFVYHVKIRQLPCQVLPEQYLPMIITSKVLQSLITEIGTSQDIHWQHIHTLGCYQGKSKLLFVSLSSVPDKLMSFVEVCSKS